MTRVVRVGVVRENRLNNRGEVQSKGDIPYRFLMINTMNHDITHCSGEGCPKRRKCYRYRAYKEMHIAEVVQVFIEPPYFEGECKFFIED